MTRHQHPKRIRIGLALGTAALGLAGLTACLPADASTSVEVAADLGPEAQALTAFGFNPADLALAPGATASATPTAGVSTAASPTAGAPSAAPAGKRQRLRIQLRKHVLHGETVVQTKDGTKTVAVQRGTVTAISATSLTVKSTDGFTQTWTIGSQIDVLQHRTTVQPSAIKVGAQLGVAGPKTDAALTARVILLAP
jgi:hypothetical protein